MTHSGIQVSHAVRIANHPPFRPCGVGGVPSRVDWVLADGEECDPVEASILRRHCPSRRLLSQPRRKRVSSESSGTDTGCDCYAGRGDSQLVCGEQGGDLTEVGVPSGEGNPSGGLTETGAGLPGEYRGGRDEGHTLIGWRCSADVWQEREASTSARLRVSVSEGRTRSAATPITYHSFESIQAVISLDRPGSSSTDSIDTTLVSPECVKLSRAGLIVLSYCYHLGRHSPPLGCSTPPNHNQSQLTPPDQPLTAKCKLP